MIRPVNSGAAYLAHSRDISLSGEHEALPAPLFAVTMRLPGGAGGLASTPGRKAGGEVYTGLTLYVPSPAVFLAGSPMKRSGVAVLH